MTYIDEEIFIVKVPAGQFAEAIKAFSFDRKDEKSYIRNIFSDGTDHYFQVIGKGNGINAVWRKIQDWNKSTDTFYGLS